MGLKPIDFTNHKTKYEDDANLFVLEKNDAELEIEFYNVSKIGHG